MQTITTIKELNKKERILEIANLISGEGISKTSLKTAEELLTDPELKL